jgi:DNA-binding XRE family transcriptional regulator
MVAMLAQMLRRDREQAGISVARASWLVGVSPREYREIEEGTLSPGFETWDRICKLFGWPQSFG